MVDKCLHDLKVKIFNKGISNELVAFLNTFIIGFIAYFPLMIDFSYSKDANVFIYGEDCYLIVIAGRFFLAVLSEIQRLLGSKYFINITNLILMIIIMSFVSSVVIKILELENKILIAIVSSLLILSPAMLDVCRFPYLTQWFSLSILFASLAVLFTKNVLVNNEKYIKLIFPIIFMILQMGTYQSNVSVSLALFILLIIKYAFDENFELKKLFKFIFTFLIVSIISLVLYMIVLKIFSTIMGVQISNDRNIIWTISHNIKNVFFNIIKSIGIFVLAPVFSYGGGGK